MKDIDAVIDNKPTIKLIKELATLKIENLDAFRELDSLNNTGDFLYKHPLIKHFSYRSELTELLKRDPEEYLNSYARAKENVKRYSSFVKSAKRTDEQKIKDKASLAKWISDCDIHKSILEEKNQD